MTPDEKASLWFGRTFCLTATESFRKEYPSPESLAAAMQAYNGATRKAAGRQQGVSLLDAESELPKSLENFTDDVHYTPGGARRLAVAVQRHIDAAGHVEAWLR